MITRNKPIKLFIMGAAGPALILGTAILATGANAQDKEDAITAPPAIYTELVGCKTIADPAQRLACFDEKVAALESATESKQVVIADREQVKEARRGLFGLSLPRIKLFGGDKDEGAEIKEIEVKIASVRSLRGSKWLIRLEDGATWQSTEPSRSTSRSPKKGDSIRIKRGSLGSFTAFVNGSRRGFKVKRVVN